MQISSKYSLVVGAGITGQACIRHLLKENKQVKLIDTRKKSAAIAEFLQNYPQVDSCFGEINLDWCINASEIIISPGVNPKLLDNSQYKQRNIPLRGDLDIFASINTKPQAAITGTNGKTTVVTLVNLMANSADMHAQAIGNIGISALDVLELDYAMYINECSSFQLETTTNLAATVACILNIAADHLNRYSDMAEYAETKHKIYNSCDVAVYNRQDLATKPTIACRRVVSFGLDCPQFKDDWGLCIQDEKEHLCMGTTPILPATDLALSGEVNVANALAAACIAYNMGVPVAAIKNTLQKFTGLTHRFTTILADKGVSWVNDSKATNVSATIAALKSLTVDVTPKNIIILGGDAKGASLDALVPIVLAKCAIVIVIGKDKLLIEKLFSQQISLISVNSMQDAVNCAYTNATPGATVLLSPACASTDMYNNYTERGDEFTELVKNKYKNYQ